MSIIHNDSELAVQENAERRRLSAADIGHRVCYWVCTVGTVALVGLLGLGVMP